MLLLIFHELLYRTCVSFLAAVGFAFIFRVSGTFDVSAPALSFLWLYFCEKYIPPFVASLAVAGSALCIWWVVFRKVSTSVILSLACSIAVMLVAQALTTMIFGDRLIALGSLPRIFPSDTLHEIIWTGCIALTTAGMCIVWKLQPVTRNFRSVMENSDLARCYGIQTDRVKVAAYAAGVACIFIAAVLWQSETPLTSNNSAALLLYGIAIGSWGRRIGFVRMLFLAILLSAVSMGLAYRIGPVSTGISYLVCAVAMVALNRERRTADA